MRTRLKRYGGQIHGFLTLVGLFDGGREALDDIAEVVRSHLAILAASGDLHRAAHPAAS